MKKISVLLTIICWLQHTLHAQTVQGRVISAATGTPLAGATVTVATSGLATLTTTQGGFSIPVSPIDTLRVSHIGYHLQQVPLTPANRQSLVVELQPLNQQLQAVTISTGYQQLPAERSTGAFSFLNERLLNRAHTTDIISRLDGTAPALLFDKRLATPKLNIRGRSTIYANADPLIVLDNFPFEGDVKDINPADVESITLLKDAAAASIWGTRAGNGVIVITTKKGRSGQPPQVSFNANTTITAKPDLFAQPFMPAADFAEVERFLFSKGFYNSQETNASHPALSPVVEILIRQRSGSITAAQADEMIKALSVADVRKDAEKYLYEQAVNQQYNLQLWGGGSHNTYRLSLGWDENKNELAATYNRVTSRLTTSFRLHPKLELTTVFAYTLSSSRTGKPSLASIAPASAKDLLPYTRLADEDGNPLPIPKNYRESFLSAAEAAGLPNWHYVPLEDYRNTSNTNGLQDLLMNASLQYRISPSLSASALGQFQKTTTDNRNLQGQNAYLVRDLINRFAQVGTNGSLTFPVPLGNILDLSLGRQSAYAGRVQLDFNHTWQAHRLSTIAGGEIRQTTSRVNSYRTYGYNDNVLTYANVNYDSAYRSYVNPASRSRIPPAQEFGEGINKFISAYVNTAYTFKSRYTFSASARRDGSNLFGVKTNQKLVPLWSAGASWLLSAEPFYRFNALPYLKLRATWGYNGNVDNSLSAYTIMNYYSGSSNAFINAAYGGIVSLPNPELRWEKVATSNLGIDLATAGNRVRGSLDLFRKKATDLIGDAPVDPTVGWPSGKLRRNIGAMTTTGFDLDLSVTNIRTKLQWNTRYILSYNNTRLLQYDSISTFVSSYLTSGVSVVPLTGKPLYNIFSYQWAGLDGANGDPQGFLNGTVTKNYTALANESKVADLVYNGSAVPVLFGSVLNTFECKAWELSFNITFRLGYFFRRTSLNDYTLYNNWRGHPDYSLRWQKPGDELHTNVPSLVYPANIRRGNFYTYSSVLVEPADNIRLQDLRLAYSLEKAQHSRLPVQNLQLFVVAGNLGILWRANHLGLDPDYYSVLPPAPSLSFGLKTTF